MAATDTPRRETWRKPTLYAALVLLAGAALIGAVVALSAMTGVDWQPLRRTPNVDRERGVEIQPYALPPRPETPDRLTSPARRQTYHGTASWRPAPVGRPQAADRAAPAAPTPLASGEFVAAVGDGRKVFLPNAAGDCEFVGRTGSSLIQSFDDCFAGKRAGR